MIASYELLRPMSDFSIYFQAIVRKTRLLLGGAVDVIQPVMFLFSFYDEQAANAVRQTLAAPDNVAGIPGKDRAERCVSRYWLGTVTLTAMSDTRREGERTLTGSKMGDSNRSTL